MLQALLAIREFILAICLCPIRLARQFDVYKYIISHRFSLWYNKTPFNYIHTDTQLSLGISLLTADYRALRVLHFAVLYIYLCRVRARVCVFVCGRAFLCACAFVPQCMYFVVYVFNCVVLTVCCVRVARVAQIRK